MSIRQTWAYHLSWTLYMRVQQILTSRVMHISLHDVLNTYFEMTSHTHDELNACDQLRNVRPRKRSHRPTLTQIIKMLKLFGLQSILSAPSSTMYTISTIVKAWQNERFAVTTGSTRMQHCPVFHYTCSPLQIHPEDQQG